MKKIATMKLIAETPVTNANSLTMTSMRAVWHHFFIWLVYQNCFAYLVLVLIALSMALSISRMVR